MLFNQSKRKCNHFGQANGKETYEMHLNGFPKNLKRKRYRGDNTRRFESEGTIWNRSQKGEPVTKDDQTK